MNSGDKSEAETVQCYEVSFDAFQHVVVDAKDEDGARQKAYDQIHAHDWNINDTRVNGPYDD